jgi:glycine cleavage system H lipoate-binding protein
MNAGRKATKQREWVHVVGAGAVTVGLAQLDAEETIGQEVQALLG